MTPVISVEHISKSYHLGVIGSGSFADDMRMWWARARGKTNPLLRIGEDEHADRIGEEIWALRDISFTVNQGEVLGIIGRNGAGKSTLLKILSRVTAPTSGLIKVKGRIASLLEVGTGFHPDLTGRENIYLNGATLGMSRAEVHRKLDEIVAFSGIAEFLDTPVKRYSSGMYVRLAFAVAAHLESDILLVDEVLAVGDAEFQRKCLGKMGDIANGGRTVFFVSHNMGSIKSLCTRGLLIKKGRIADDNVIEDVIGKYLEEFNLNTGLLKDRTDRQGNGLSRLELININGGLEDKKQAVFTGGPVVFQFYISSVLPGMECVFNIYDELGVALARFSSGFGSNGEKINAVENCFSCYIKELPLSPGHYRINVAISKNGILLDRLESAATFIVEQANNSGGRRTPSDSSARISLPHQWLLPSLHGRE
jgi:lipopolysaccharide transport system ATP-binding protein